MRRRTPIIALATVLLIAGCGSSSGGSGGGSSSGSAGDSKAFCAAFDDFGTKFDGSSPPSQADAEAVFDALTKNEPDAIKDDVDKVVSAYRSQGPTGDPTSDPAFVKAYSQVQLWVAANCS
jgi:hypothetical protein